MNSEHPKEDQDFLNEDALLLERFIEGDDEPFVELFDRHNRRLYLYALKILGDGAQAEDITQEIWERVIKLRERPQKIANPAAFLATIARNLCFNRLKMQKRRLILNAFAIGPDVVDSPHEPSDLEALVAACVGKLPLEYREVLVLNVYCDYGYDEIASMLGKSVTAIRMRASRARGQLRTMLEEHSELSEYRSEFLRPDDQEINQ